jgi:hypothetical protein
VPTPPAPQSQHIVVPDLGDKLGRRELRMREDQLDQALGILGPGMVIADIEHIARGHIAQLQRCTGDRFGFQLRSEIGFKPSSSRFRRSTIRASCSSTILPAFDPDFRLPVLRLGVFVEIHPLPLRLRRSIKSVIADSSNIRRSRFLPRPTFT